MPDFMTSAQRSKAMSAVRAKDTAIERALRSGLHKRGYRFRKNVRTLPGRPDVVLPKYRCVVFVHGCFWHHHANCKRAKLPETRPVFWAKKIRDNVERDRRQTRALRKDGWRVLVIWQCSLNSPAKRERAVDRLVKSIGH